ncbi:MAG: hypothetical protein GY798_17955 [Hyphomicrobiales bacterium]|nr:hypothetical protein [Hyphomicrobiales bacterium]
MLIHVPVSVGEFFDKITILRIKAERLTDPGKLENVLFELGELEAIAKSKIQPSPQLGALVARLHAVNVDLWEIEDAKRAAEREKRFDADFITLARSVYQKNDLRARLKKEINLLLGSRIVEEKEHSR